MKRFDLDQTDSTNTQAAALVKQHPGDALLVTAKTQSAGRGRRGRSWQSPAGGAWFSLALPLRQVNEMISIEAAHALCDALSGWLPRDRFVIKPPNDVLLDGKKVAGILCEQTLAPAGRDGAFPGTTAIVGVGINVNNDPQQLGEQLRHPATSLASVLGNEVDVAAVIERCVEALCKRLADAEPTRGEA